MTLSSMAIHWYVYGCVQKRFTSTGHGPPPLSLHCHRRNAYATGVPFVTAPLTGSAMAGAKITAPSTLPWEVGVGDTNIYIQPLQPVACRFRMKHKHT